ncbi:type VI secretion system Vgr family protein [Caballeronia grimmiae]|uniref:type VI secretion system Vgr family protein n=1 Tax=Caballeronia grimmiae TaxID=1071679 RepID=UPI0038B804BF
MIKFDTPRTLTVSGPALPTLPTGEDALHLVSIEGNEHLSKIYTYTLDLLTPANLPMLSAEAANFDLNEMVGQELTVTVQLDGMGVGNIGAGTREISGIVSEARFMGQRNHQSHYQVILRPWVHFADQQSNYRIFQAKTVVEIIDEVLSAYMYSWQKRLSAQYPTLEYQVQYGETDFAFIQRLMQEHGIYWFFEHSKKVHRMVLVDQLGAHKPVDSEAYQTLWYYPPGHKIDQEYIDTFQAATSIQSGKWTTNDFNFKTPKAKLGADNALPQNTVHNALERYEWPGDYADAESGENVARLRMQQVRAQGERMRGSGHVRNVVCGTTFHLQGYAQRKANREYLVIDARFSAKELDDASGPGQFEINTSFLVQPATTVYRPERDVPKPRTTGPQTAVVTGPEGHEIWTDQYGRVKLKFHWDRSPVRNQKSSCWVRVSYPWAGNNYGTINVPRVGSEVIVDFENGDPDRPIVTDRVYNAANMPPWQLPDNATQSGTLSRSTTEGGYGHANAIRFEDKKGKEELWIHAEKDMRTEVEHDESHSVEHDRRKNVDHDETTTIGHDRTETVGNSEQVDVGHDRRHHVGHDDSLSVDRSQILQIGKDRIEHVGNHREDHVTANHTVKIGGHAEHRIEGQFHMQAGEAADIKTKALTLQAGGILEIRGPAGTITLDANGITLEASKITLKGPVQASSGWVKNALDLRSKPADGKPLDPATFSFSG